MTKEDSTEANSLTEILHSIQMETCWHPSRDGTKLQTRLSELQRGTRQRVEVVCSRPESAASLVILCSSAQPDAAAVLGLHNPLEKTIVETTGRFTRTLANAHRAIASEHATQYTSPVTHPVLVARADIPHRFDPRLLVRTFQSLGSMAHATDDLHEALLDILVGVQNSN